MSSLSRWLFLAGVLMVAGCGGGGGGGGGGSSGGSSGPAPYRILDLSTGAVTESASLPDLTATVHTTTKMVFRRVSSGSFSMGQVSTALGSQTGETPAVVAVPEFWIAVLELTQGQWLTMTNSAPVVPWRDVEPSTIAGSSVTITNRAAFGLTFSELSSVVAAWNSGKTGQVSIPSETQWEYACRAGSTTLFYWGDSLDPSVAGQYAFCRETISGASGPGLVGLGRISNGLNLWDMHGNVREWATTSGQPVLRGGSWADNLLVSRSANRMTSVDQGMRHGLSGARLILTAP